jgi:O-antigen/teichoic acid export membrane protein
MAASRSKISLRHTLLALILLLLAAFVLGGCQASRSTEPANPLAVYYTGAPASNGVSAALQIADQNGAIALVDDPSQADVIVANGAAPDLPAITQQLQEGAGLVLFMGKDLSQDQVEALLGFPVELASYDSAASLAGLEGLDDPLITEILWNGAPQVRQRFETITPLSSVQPLVTADEDGSWILWHDQTGRKFIFNAFLQDANPQIQEWAYFNYLVYSLVIRAGGSEPLSFADYPGSPLPHAAERNLLFGLMALVLLTAGAAFWWVRRYSLAHPEALDRIVSDPERFRKREASTSWEEVGFHRPLSGFLIALGLGLLLFIPLIIYQNLVLPVYILPSAQALGTWGRVTQFFSLAWTFFDLGTSVAFIKYLSEYRVHDPKRGIQYGQLFIWWQALSGAVQVTIVVALASTLAPRSAYALYAWSVIIHALIQVPGFFQVFRHALNGLQRQDYARILDVSLNVVMPILVQPLFVGAMYAWGKEHPVMGGAMGGLLGLGIAAYAAELFTFLIGFWLYRRIGYSARILFLAHFDGQVVKNSFRFGIFEMLGSLAWSAGQAAEIAITQGKLINYAEIWGNWGLAQNFVFAYNVLQTLNDAVMPAISEAISSGRRLLSQYYAVQAYKYGGMISAFLGAVLLAVADRFILGASGPEFVRASLYVVPLVIWGAIQYPSWVGDIVQLGSNKPYLKSLLVLGEQVIRVVLALVLLERLQIYALIVAYFAGLLTKDIVAYFVNHRLCFPQRFYFWQSLAAPLLAGAVHFAFMRWLGGLLWQGDAEGLARTLSSVLIFFIGILPSFPLYMFLFGLFGGWDPDTLDELQSASRQTGWMRPLAWLVWASTWLGTRLSPLHGKFPITIRAAALEEARGLTLERVDL